MRSFVVALVPLVIFVGITQSYAEQPLSFTDKFSKMLEDQFFKDTTSSTKPAHPFPTFPRDYTTFGIGNLSCATWISSDAMEVQGDEWIAGFWSAANVFWGSSVGATTDLYGIDAEIRKECLDQPSGKLIDASKVVYYRFYLQTK